MKMPDGDVAIVDRQKLTGYCLNPEHPRGKHKARVFATLGFTAENADAASCAADGGGQRRRTAGGIGSIR